MSSSVRALLDPPSGPAFRDVPGDDDLLFRLDNRALQRLESFVREGINASPRLSVEVGGLVIGSMADAGDSVVMVTEVVPVEIFHRDGPLYRPSPGDRQAFADAMLQFAGSQSQAIGFFRSDLREPAAARDEDLELLRFLFGDQNCCMILVQAGSQGRSIAHFYARTGEKDIVSAAKVSQEVQGSQAVKVAASAASAYVSTPYDSTIPNSDVRALQPPQPRPAPRRAIWALGAIAAVSAGLAAFALVRLSTTRPQPQAPVGLNITTTGSAVRLSWDAANSAVKNATHASLTVMDGVTAHRVELRSDQLRSGSYEYKPLNPDLIVVLTVYQGNTFTGENRSYHIDLPATNAPASIAELPAKAAIAAPPARAPRSNPPDPKPSSVASHSAPLPAPQHAPALPPTPPAVSTQNATPIASAQLLTQKLETPDIPQPLKAAAPSAVLSTAPLTPPVTFSAPVAVTRVGPAVPPDARSLIQEPVNIRVTVHVDASGKVANAFPLDASSRLEKLLAPHAVQAAKLWRFEPARRDGVPVAGETVVMFRFDRQ